MATPTVIIDLEPNWNDPPEVGYGFETAIQMTPYFLQQRRPLLPTPKRSVNCKYLLDRQKLQYARNLFLYGASKLCCIPIYSEPVQSAAVTQGASAIVASTDITYFWNIKNSDYVVLLDWVTGASEMIAVASVSGQTINLSSAIVNAWTAAQTIIYPAFAGKISAIKGLEKTSLVGDVSAEFEEIAVSEEATKVWVGLEEQVCVGVLSPVTLIIDDGNFAWQEAATDGTNHGPAWHSSTPYRVYLGDAGSNGRLNQIFYPTGVHAIQFDFYHHDIPFLDYWTDDDYTDAQVFVSFIGVGFAYHTMTWGYASPYYSPGVAEVYGFIGPQIRFYLHKLTTAKISVRTFPSWAFAADAAISGLRTGAADYNTYKFECNFANHTVSGWVNGFQFINSASFSSEADASLASGFHMIIHSHKYTYGSCYVKNVRAM